jgi:glycosyltransferase involved in cell wall biosynthesis
MKRVCIVRLQYYPWQKNVRRNAETLVRAGYDVDIVCPRQRGEKKRENLNGVNVYRLPLRHHRGSVPWYLLDYTAFFILAFLKLAQLSLRKRYDVVEVNTMPDFLVFVTIFVRLLGSKVILYMFENMPALFMSTFKTDPNHVVARLLRFIEKISSSYAHHVIVSDGLAYKQVLESRGIPSEKITVVLNVPDDTIFNLESLPPTKDGDHFRLIVVSTLVKRYGVQTVVKAVPLLIKDIPELRVDIVGNGEYQPDLERMVGDLGVAPYLNFVGWTPLDTVPTYIARANIGVAPMIDDVGLPNKLFDYFALEKPTIVSALSSLKDTFNNADCVAFFSPNDEKDLAARVLELYRHPEKRTSLVTHARRFYQKHRWTVLKHEYLKVFEELTS